MCRYQVLYLLVLWLFSYVSSEEEHGQNGETHIYVCSIIMYAHKLTHAYVCIDVCVAHQTMSIHPLR